MKLEKLFKMINILLVEYLFPLHKIKTFLFKFYI